jgi:hypothetical protein
MSAGSMALDMPVARDVLRLAMESDSSAIVERSPTIDPRALNPTDPELDQICFTVSASIG